MPDGPNASVADLRAGTDGARFTATLPLNDVFTIEALVHFDDFTTSLGKAIAGFGVANDAPWSFQVRVDGLFGTTPGELILGGATLTTGTWVAPSGLVLSPGVDYYVAAAFDLDGVVTFWVQDLTNDGPLLSNSADHGITQLPDDTRFVIGDTYDSNADYELNGLIDDVRLSNRVLSDAELLINNLP
jgi:hypothetical protein